MDNKKGPYCNEIVLCSQNIDTGLVAMGQHNGEGLCDFLERKVTFTFTSKYFEETTLGKCTQCRGSKAHECVI